MKRYSYYFFTIFIFLIGGCANSPDRRTNTAITGSNHANIITRTYTESSVSTDRSDTSFEGCWVGENNDSDYEFDITFTRKGKWLIGTYGCVADGGNRIDDPDPDDSNDYSFKIRNPLEHSFVTKFKEYYADAYGKVKISLISGKLHWKIIIPPGGTYYVPDTAVLIRCSGGQQKKDLKK